MIKTRSRYLSLIYWIAIIGTDIFVYIILSVLQMDYDDNYTISKGEYWSLASMTQQQLFFYISLQLWNILNIIGIIFIARKIYKRIKTRKEPSQL